MARDIEPDRIKTVIDFIKEGPRGWKELKTLKLGDRIIDDKALDRTLKKLKLWGLIYQDEDKRWNWYLSKQEFENILIYDLALEHSRYLVSGNAKPGDSEQDLSGVKADQGLLYIFWHGSEDPKEKNFFQHLKRGYSDVYRRFEEFSKLLDKRGQILKNNLEKNNQKKPRSRPTSLSAPNQQREIALYNSRYHVPIFAEERWWKMRENLLIKPPPDYSKKKEITKWQKFRSQFSAQDLETLRELDESLLDIMECIPGKISTILQRVKHGIPLEGYCDFCPHKRATIKS